MKGRDGHQFPFLTVANIFIFGCLRFPFCKLVEQRNLKDKSLDHISASVSGVCSNLPVFPTRGLVVVMQHRPRFSGELEYGVVTVLISNKY